MEDDIPFMANHPNRSARKRAGPKSSDVLKARQAAGLTQDQAGELVHSGWRTWQNWESDNPDEGREMHPASWELFNVKVNAREMLERGEITEKQLRALGLKLPPSPPRDPK